MLRRASILSLLLLAGCSSVRGVGLTVRDAQSSEPAPGVRVRAISLNSGTVPLPLNSATLDEILASGKVETAATTGPDGVARLRLRAKAPYLVELVPSPFSGVDGASALVSRFVLSEHSGNIRPADDAPGPQTYTLEVNR